MTCSGRWWRSVLAVGARRALEQDRGKEVEPPGLKESDRLDAEDGRHQPVPEEVGGDSGNQGDNREDHDGHDADHHSNHQLLEHGMSSYEVLHSGIAMVNHLSMSHPICQG